MMTLPQRHSTERFRTRILIVDDSEDDAFLLSERLARAIPQCECTRVDSAESLRMALKGEDWDMVISDHAMPGFNSSEALQILKESGRETPVIIYSGQLDQSIGVSAMARGARDFVPKNSPERLIPAMQRELENARLRREKARADLSIVRLARYDGLTGLPNRAQFCDEVAAHLNAVNGMSARGALFYVDLDRFMRINDSFGYPTGDALIQQIAARLRGCLARSDMVSRLGQDEFAVFSPAVTDANAATALAERILQRFAPAIVQNDQEFFVTASIGASVHPQHGEDENTLLKNAESAMFAVKRQGRNGFRLYQHELNNLSIKRLKMENDLRHAIERGQLHLVYQPILDMATNRIVSTEALIRWRHPELGMVPPDQFIPLADETGLIYDIGEWVARSACRQIGLWQKHGFTDLCVAVNVSAQQFRQEHLVERMRTILDEAGVDAHRLELEITETVAMQDAESTTETLRQLKAMGVGISIDDFGTGYSSLSYLKRFPIDTLKIDRSFVRDISVDADDAAIVEAVASLARTLKLRVLAEGVETREQFEYLALHGCDRMQGFYLSKPLEAADFSAFMENHLRLNPPRQSCSEPAWLKLVVA